ncbi:MAG: hypothetical protein H7Y59_15440 [Anaerolineales bacterium]|nr:hypothetical protein [Anaerolineales bacterium]
MTSRINIHFFLFIGVLIAILFMPFINAKAQAVCFDPSGGVIPCPPTSEPEKEEQRRTKTPIPPTATYTSTPTHTATVTFTSTSTLTATPTATIPSLTSTITLIPTSTPLFSNPATNWMPGIGIGAFILLFIVMVFLPAIQKVRVTKRGY